MKSVVERIDVTARGSAVMERVDEVKTIEGCGIEGDRYCVGTAMMVAMATPAFAAQPTYYCEVDINGGHFIFTDLIPRDAHHLMNQNDTAVCTRNR